MYPTTVTWLVNHPVFRGLASSVINERLLVAYVEGFAPVVNSVPAFLHVTMSRAQGKAAELLREIWNDELGLTGTKAHPVLFDDVHRAVTQRWGSHTSVQSFGVTAAVNMIQLCASGPWPIGVAAMKAHESQFPVAYGTALPALEKILGPPAEFFRVHSQADVEHTETGSQLLQSGIAEAIVSAIEADEVFERSTRILRELMDRIWESSQKGTGDLLI